jgi:hypothetical protein
MARTAKAAAPKAKPPKAKAAPKKAKKLNVEELVDVEVVNCKDYLACRWEITEEGQLVTWQPEEDGRPTLSTVPGKISDVVFEKMCAFVGDDSVKKTVQNTKPY